MSDRTCDWCDKPVRWLQVIDNTPLDTIWRRFYGMPGRTATPMRACEDHAELLDRERVEHHHWHRGEFLDSVDTSDTTP